MALYVNNRNVVSYCFIKNDEITLLNVTDSSEESLKLFNLKCTGLETTQKTNVSNPKLVKEQYVVTAAVSNCSNYVSACDSSNLLHLWKFSDNSWNHLSSRSLLRKCQKIIFTNSGSEVIVADRGGDVYAFSVFDDKREGKFLLGHICLIIDIFISHDDKYLLTCDRDGKIRVSFYPNCYNIHSYCLGHEEFVSSVQCVQLSKELILSASGDGSVRLWDFNGDNITYANLFENDVMCEKLSTCVVKSKENGENSLSCILNEKQTVFAVKHIKYSCKNKLCVISFYSIKGVAIYQVAHVKDISFNFVQFIPLESIPFDVLLHMDENLIVLQRSIKSQYLYFKLVEKGNVQFEAVDSDTVFVAKEIQKLCGNIQSLKEVQEDFEALFKRNYENFDDKDDCSMENKSKTKKSKKT